jgi:SynChlorMet cassette protein ScmC
MIDNDDPELFNIQVMLAAGAIVTQVESSGGLLIHGALAEIGGIGVILAGPGGAGKSTASARLPSPWRSLCDDSSLVVRDNEGNYWAHPWPTWSRFQFSGPGGSWDVQHAIPLHAVFFLNRSDIDQVEKIGKSKAASMLTLMVEQVTTNTQQRMAIEEVRSARLQRFENVCDLTMDIPAYILRLSEKGAFWGEIERVLY